MPAGIRPGRLFFRSPFSKNQSLIFPLGSEPPFFTMMNGAKNCARKELLSNYKCARFKFLCELFGYFHVLETLCLIADTFPSSIKSLFQHSNIAYSLKGVQGLAHLCIILPECSRSRSEFTIYPRINVLILAIHSRKSGISIWQLQICANFSRVLGVTSQTPQSIVHFSGGIPKPSWHSMLVWRHLSTSKSRLWLPTRP